MEHTCNVVMTAFYESARALLLISVGFWSRSLWSSCEEVKPIASYTDYELLEEWWRRYPYGVPIFVIGIVLSLIYILFRLLKWFFLVLETYRKALGKDATSVVSGILPAVYEPLYVPEKAVPGSTYFKQERPAFAVHIYIPKIGSATEWVFQGMGWRLKDSLITAHHNLHGTDKIRVKAGEKFVDVDVSKFEDRSADVAVCILSPSDWTTLQVKSAKVPKLALPGAVIVFAYSNGVASSGTVTTHNTIPYVEYGGSTKPGFSGTPLYVNSTVYAMHVGAGNTNLAVDAAWIGAVAIKCEASEDWVYEEIERMAKKGRTTKYRMFSPGEALVLVGGEYHTLDIEDIPEYVRDALEFVSAQTDYHGEAAGLGHGRITPKVTLDEGHLNLKGASALAEARKLKAGSDVSRPNGVVQLPPSVSTNIPVEASTAGLESTLAQLSAVLGSIQPSQPKSKRSAKKKSRSKTRGEPS